MDRLLEIEEFTNETKLSLGDLLDLVAALSAAQAQALPPAKKLNLMKEQIVPARNNLLHGREVNTRTLLIALLAADELTDNLIGNVNE